MALAVYRRYRPKFISELIGQESITEVLKNAASTDRLAHAYLFYGPRGCGKTSAARIVAKLANCETRNSDPEFRAKGEPCNNCRACNEIDEGRALDVIEIDAASNRGIDEIRSLKEGIRLSPTSYKYKVFIIDEVHQLTKEAFNALLKTLEEPPAHAIFILATTEFDKLPATIVSRTQRFAFKKITVPKIIEKLKLIITSENVEVDPAALELIAASADGGLRDAESLLEQVISLEDKKITLEEVERILGKIGTSKVSAFTSALVTLDLSKSLELLAEIDDLGYNLVELVKDTISHLRRVLVLNVDPNMAELFRNELTGESLKTLQSQAALASKTDLVRLLKALIGAYGEMRYSPFAIIPLEVAIIESLKK